MKKTISLFPSILVMFLLFSCSNDSRNIKDMLNGKSNEDTARELLKEYNFNAHIVYDNAKYSADVNMSLIFLPRNNRVMWIGRTSLGYEVPLGIGTYDAKTGDIRFDHSDPLNDMWHFQNYGGTPENLTMRLKEDDSDIILHIIKGNNVRKMFNGKTTFRLKEVKHNVLENALEGTNWKSDDEKIIYFISDHAAIYNEQVCLYAYSNGKIAIVSKRDPIGDQAEVGDINGNTMYLIRDGLIGGNRGKTTFKKF